MHELSIANAVVEACAERAGGSRVIRVRLEIGALAAVMEDAVGFCFDVCAKDTVVEGAALEVVAVAGRGECSACGASVAITSPIGRCACGSIDLRIVAGEELRVKEMEVA
jgi:hydrogenase nickel incorporation protein HypA/HybF